MVRLLDYVVGIANGQFLPRDHNLQSRRKARQSSFFSINSKKLADNYQQTSFQSVFHDNLSSKPPSKQTSSGTTETYKNYRNGNNPSSDTGLTPSIDDVQMRAKVQEIRLLLNKYYAPNHAKQFFELITDMAIIGIENIDKVLAFLCEADRESVNYGNLFEMLSNVTDRTDNLVDKPHLNLPQKLSDKGIQHRMSPERYLRGKATLVSIEQLLLPYYPQEFVRNVITGLTKEFDITGDLSSLNTAFENHQKNVQRYIRLK